MAIRIVTDSVADLPTSVAQAHDISVVPLYVVIDGKTYRDGVDIDADEFYARLVKAQSLPTTSQPTVADFQEVYQRLLDEGHSIVSVHVSSKLSGTLNSATQAKASLGNTERIQIVDSQLAGGAQGLLALNASRWAGEMTARHELAARVRDSIGNNHGFVLVDTLKYLEKGGRIGKAQAFLGSVLNFKPIITIRDGEAHPLERPRSRRRAHARIVDYVHRLAPISHIQVSYSTGRENALRIGASLADLVPPENFVHSRFGPVLGTHLGPNTIGVAVTQGRVETA
ncbi:MAG: DegV family protein [Chloroflexi bacterium]|nr:DegV family protein [Chloroflexota bacterium]